MEAHSRDIGVIVAGEFKITRQAANKHLRRLVEEHLLTADGNTQRRSYRLAPLFDWSQSYQIVPGIAEHDVWDKDIAGIVRGFPKNVVDIWQFCFTEMFNNAVDHSGGSSILVRVTKTAINVQMMIQDDGVGIFKKIQVAMNLSDERSAILELAKGKLTTDPSHHSGQGIFFTSRLLDSFDILAGGVFFTHHVNSEQDWMLERSESMAGTTIFMKLNNHSDRLDEEVFKKFSSEDGVSFSKTIVPVTLARYGQEKLVSRSQAKKLLARVDQFETVILDFTGVDAMGQAFADEIFRVFVRSHPQTKIVAIHASDSIGKSIEAAQAGWLPVSLRDQSPL